MLGNRYALSISQVSLYPSPFGVNPDGIFNSLITEIEIESEFIHPSEVVPGKLPKAFVLVF